MQSFVQSSVHFFIIHFSTLFRATICWNMHYCLSLSQIDLMYRYISCDNHGDNREDDFSCFHFLFRFVWAIVCAIVCALFHHSFFRHFFVRRFAEICTIARVCLGLNLFFDFCNVMIMGIIERLIFHIFIFHFFLVWAIVCTIICVIAMVGAIMLVFVLLGLSYFYISIIGCLRWYYNMYYFVQKIVLQEYENCWIRKLPIFVLIFLFRIEFICRFL